MTDTEIVLRNLRRLKEEQEAPRWVRDLFNAAALKAAARWWPERYVGVRRFYRMDAEVGESSHGR